MQPGIVIDAQAVNDDHAVHAHAPADCCDYCGSARLQWRKCKLVCTNCQQINKSCADL